MLHLHRGVREANFSGVVERETFDAGLRTEIKQQSYLQNRGPKIVQDLSVVGRV